MPSIVIDAFTGERSNTSPLAQVAINATSEAIRIGGGRRIDSGAGSIVVARDGAMDKLRHQRLDRIARQMAQRNDALSSNTGSFPRDFEFIYNEQLNEVRRPLNWQRLWQMDTRVPLGFKTHTVRRRLGTGDAKIVRAGTEVPVVGHQRVEEQFNVIYIAAAVEVDWFSMISDSVEGRNEFADDTAMAIRAIDERINDIAFDGDAPSNVPGFLNYPFLAKSVSPETYVAGGGGSAAVDIVRDLNIGANFASETSGGAFSPDRAATSLRLRNFLMQTQNSVASDISIGSFWLSGQQDINDIVGVQELEGIGPSGEDGIIFYRDSLDSTTFVMVQAPTAMPVFQIDSFRNQVVYIAAVGGTVMRDAGNNHLRFATATL